MDDDPSLPRDCSLKQAADKTFHCYFELSQMIIGGKWKPKILFYLSHEGPMRFGVLRDSIRGVSEKMLIQQLRELERDGIVHREVYKQVPPKVEYSLTGIGETLIPIMRILFKWGKQYASFRIATAEGRRIDPGQVLEDLDAHTQVEIPNGAT